MNDDMRFWEPQEGSTRYSSVVKLQASLSSGCTPPRLYTTRLLRSHAMQSQYTLADGWPESVVSRFWSKVDRNGPAPEHLPDLGPCWLWTAGTSGGGYGKIGVRAGLTMDAHKVSWIFHFGEIACGLWVLHRCDVVRCVRPSHLFLGTAADNNRDMFEKHRDGARVEGWAHHFECCQSCMTTVRKHGGKGLCSRCYSRAYNPPRSRRQPRTHCSAGHVLSGDNLYLWRGHRICKACRKAGYAADWQREKDRRNRV